MAQINSTVGDLAGNREKIRAFIDRAKQAGSDIVIFPELALVGYPPQDLLTQTDIVDESARALQGLYRDTEGIVAAIGFVEKDGDTLYNSAAILQDGEMRAVVRKTNLPTYDVFDEACYFTPAKEAKPVKLIVQDKPLAIGFEICEDLWNGHYRRDVTDILAMKGAQLIITLNASPYYVGKTQDRIELLRTRAQRCHLPIFYTNLVGGQDELVFDGHSFAVGVDGSLIALGAHFQEDLVVTDLDLGKGTAPPVVPPPFRRVEEMFNALALGVRDYFAKTGFRKAVIGLSGGIDSSVVAAIAKEALGAENVLGVSMPSRYSSEHSKTDAETLAHNLGIGYTVVLIEEVFSAFEKSLAESFQGLARDVTEENIQARIRGVILMALSNKFGYLVLGTGNKTELALGYCTLYGDMAAGLGALSDVSKKEVYELARHYNNKEGRTIIPETCFTKPPTAELKEGQVDPFDYAVVSPLVDEIVENRRTGKELVALGYDPALVADILRKVRSAEYKRRQAAPGIKITRKAFGIGWKMPIVNKYS